VILDSEGNIIFPEEYDSLNTYTLQELKDSTQRARTTLSSNRTKRQESSTIVPVYITAMINLSKLHNFVVGDGNVYGEYVNYPLEPDRDYVVAVALMQEEVRVAIVLFKYLSNDVL